MRELIKSDPAGKVWNVLVMRWYLLAIRFWTFWGGVHQLPHDYYWSTPRVSRQSPLFYAWPAREIQYPYHFGYTVIMRLPFTTRTFALGRWVYLAGTEGNPSVEMHLYDAMQGYSLGYRFDAPELQAAEDAFTTDGAGIVEGYHRERGADGQWEVSKYEVATPADDGDSTAPADD